VEFVLNPARFTSKQTSAFRLFRLKLSAPSCVLFLFSFPLIVALCYRWGTASLAGDPAPAIASPNSDTFLTIETRAHAVAYNLKPISNPRFGEIAGYRGEDPLQDAVSREMMIAQGDPFLLSLISGINEGPLVLKTVSGGVPVLGPALPLRTQLGYSDRELLRMLGSGVAGSFRNFYSNVFGEHPSDDALEDEQVNPFRRAREALTEVPADTQATPPEDSKTETDSPDSTETSPSQTESSTPDAVTVPATPVVTVRPHLMLRVEGNGRLSAIPVSTPREGVFESAEMGLRDFTLLPFSNPAEFPISIAVADFNSDGMPDAGFHVARQGILRLFFGEADGTYKEQVRIEIGKGPRSITSGDFNRDGRTDLAVSSIGTGTLTVLFGKGRNQFTFKSYWLDIYRDYILAADPNETGALQLLGMNFADRGITLLDFTDPEGDISESEFNYVAALNSRVTTAEGRSARLNAVVLNTCLSVNLDNRENHLTNVMNIAAGLDVYLVVGDLSGNGALTVAIARPRPVTP
jgi:hypothetical protein